MVYEEIDFITPIQEFIKGYPYLNLVGDFVVIPFSPNTIDGNGLTYSGTTRPVINKDVNDNFKVNMQANFILIIRRQLIDTIRNQEQANFVANLERWVMLEDLKGNTPKFSNFNNKDEQFWADNGIPINIEETGVPVPYIDYQVQIHINYGLEYYKNLKDYNEYEDKMNN